MNEISREAKFILKGLRFIDINKWLNYDKPKRKSLIKYARKFSAKHTRVLGQSLIHFSGQRKETAIFFLPGGAYTFQPNHGHFEFAASLNRESGLDVYVYDYPKQPESNAINTINKTLNALLKVMGKHKHIIIVGDSAGGGLTLSLIDALSDEMQKRIESVVLISPWLDLSLKNIDFTNDDLILDYDALLGAGLKYAKEMRTDDPIISPLYNTFNKDLKMFIMYSRDEMFYVDCKKFVVDKRELGLDVKELVFNELCHDWIVLPIPEMHTVVNEIVEYINQNL